MLHRLIALFLIFPTVSIGAFAGERNTLSKEAQLDRMLSDLAGKGLPGLAVSVTKNSLTLFQRGYGIRDLRSRSLVDAQTNFRLASCTKQFTAMAVMLLVHDGKLRYDDLLTDIFPDFPAYGRVITIRNLLNHTSGLPDYEDLMDKASSGPDPRWDSDRQITDMEVLKLLQSERQGTFAPGTKWSYSNSGYVVLGMIVAEVSKQPFEDFLRERIFKPLKMNRTLAFVKGKNEVSNRAYGHSKEGASFKETDQSSTSATLGDGGVYSNLEDLQKWNDALEHHTLLSESAMQPALIPVKLTNGLQPKWASGPGDADPQAGKPVSCGFGWFLDGYKGHPRMWHYGDTIGFKAAINRFTNEKLTIIVLCNRADLDAASLATKVVDLYLNDAVFTSR